MKIIAAIISLFAMTAVASAMPRSVPAAPAGLPVVKADVVKKTVIHRRPVVHRKVVKKTVVR